ncbi:dCTP deaminase [Laspinema olomoucense]|uniref:dCTP deaminase n=1 Tax=Laspinema olomoucense TaxID=3231600 RepID=UPI0021BAF07B|nr:deoxycytidine deaminase [Laspinema sp. D3c]MCT7997219.1 deoxycytidine deaminase [Laspinema sp. D3c]
MLFSDIDITKERENRQNNPEEGIFIGPFDPKFLTGVGYDLRVGDRGFSWKNKEILNIEQDRKIVIKPNDTVVIQTLESVSLSKKIGATVHSIVNTVIKKGASHISTTIDPGWTGKLYISIHNFRDVDIELYFAEPLCTVCFYELRSEAKVSPGRPPDRDDLWEHLQDIEKNERSRKIQEALRETKQKNRSKNIQLFGKVSYVIILTLVGSGVLFLLRNNTEFAASVAAFFAVISPVLYGILFEQK